MGFGESCGIADKLPSGEISSGERVWPHTNVNSANQSIISEHFHNNQDLKFVSHGGSQASRCFSQSIAASKFDVHGDINFAAVHSGASNIDAWVSQLSTLPQRWSRKLQETYQISRQAPGSGQWFLDSTNFKEWRDGEVKELLCPGILGSGKTVLSSIVINHLISHGTNRATPCLYIYFTNNYNARHDGNAGHEDNPRQNLENIIGGLLSQLIRSGSQPTAYIKSKYQAWKEEKACLSADDLLAMLQSQISLCPRVFIVIDALDECSEDPGVNVRSQLLDCLKRLPDNAHLLYTYRDIGGLSHRIAGDRKSIILKQEVSANEDDLQKYFRHRINYSHELRRIIYTGEENQADGYPFQRVMDILIERSRGMFLLAQLHVDFLVNQSFTLEHLTQNLEGMPKSPDGVYEKAMGRILIQAKFQHLAIDALTWLVYSMRTMRFSEIQHALAIQTGDSTFHADRLVTAEILTAACAGFVLIDPKTDIIRLAHYTAATYLREKQAKLFQGCQSKLAEKCLIYLSFNEFGQTTRPANLKQYLFLNYAAGNWGYHMAQGVKEGYVHKLAWGFLSSGEKVENARQAMTEAGFKHESQLSGLHLAAYFGLEMAVKKAISKGKRFSFNAQTKRGETALHWAAKFDQVQFIKLLLEQPIDLNEKDNDGRTALFHAVMLRRVSSVEALFLSTKLLKLDIVDRQGWTPLRWAAKYGPSRIVEMLLDRGADFDAQDENGWTALRWAAYQGQKNVVKQLIKYKASITSDKDGWTLLHWAAREGRQWILQILIENQIPLDFVNNEGHSALYCVVDYSQSRTAWLLINAGSDINTVDKKGNTLLHLAITRYKKSQDNSLIWLLLERGVDKNARNKLGLTPSHIAATAGYGSVLWLLLENGADMARVDNNRRTPLHWAIPEGHREIASLLLERAKNLVSVTDDQKQTALHIAALNGTLRIVQLFLRHGAKMDNCDRSGFTPLHQAVRMQHHEVVHFLVGNGADVNIPNRKMWTSLHSAAQANNISDISTIVQSGKANLRLKNKDGQTAWDLGVKHGYDIEALR